MALELELAAAAEAAVRYAAEGEEVEGVLPTEPFAGRRVYLCSYRRDARRTWLAVDACGRPVGERRLLRDAVSIAALCELAEESAGGGDLGELRARLVELRLTEHPEGIEEAEEAAAELAETLAPPPRLATPAYLDAVGLAATRLELALSGGVGGSPFAEAMKAAAGAAEELATDVERSYKRPLDGGPEGD